MKKAFFLTCLLGQWILAIQRLHFIPHLERPYFLNQQGDCVYAYNQDHHRRLQLLAFPRSAADSVKIYEWHLPVGEQTLLVENLQTQWYIFTQSTQDTLALLKGYHLDQQGELIHQAELMTIPTKGEKAAIYFHIQQVADGGNFLAFNRYPWTARQTKQLMVLQVEKDLTHKILLQYTYIADQWPIAIRSLADKNWVVAVKNYTAQKTKEWLKSHYSLLFLDSSKNIREVELNIDYKRLDQLILQPAGVNNYAIGYYTSGKSHAYEGWFSMKFGKTGDINFGLFYRFPSHFFQENEERVLYNSVIDLVSWKENQLHCIAQERFLSKKDRYTSLDQADAEEYNFSDIVYFTINAQGDLTAAYRVQQHRTVQKNELLYNHFFPIWRGNHYGFLFLDRAKTHHYNRWVWAEPRGTFIHTKKTDVLNALLRPEERLLTYTYLQEKDYFYVFSSVKNGIHLLALNPYEDL